MEAGRDYFPLLDADIMNILRTVKDRNPDIKIYGIEETDKQTRQQQGHSNSRDESIAKNFWDTFDPGLRHIILFGALHCANESNWLFHNLFSQASPTLKEEMLNVQILGEHQKGGSDSFHNDINSSIVQDQLSWELILKRPITADIGVGFILQSST